MQYKDNKFLMEADLSGNLSINKAAKLKGLDSIPFEHLVLRNEAPYFISAGTWGKVPSLGAKIMGFGINIDNVGLVKDSSGLDTKALLNFNLKLNLTKDTSLNITAGGGFQFKCSMTNVAGRHRWVPDGLKIRELYVNGSFGAVEKIAGIITFFDETTPGNTQYGKGFRGAVDLKIKNIAQVKALALFGNTTNSTGESYRYFFVDALAVFNKGVPIFTGIDLKGLGGGVYYHMNRDTTAYKGFTNSATTNVLALPVGSSLSGIKYIPDDNKGIGIKLSIMIATAKKESAFNANATFEVLFNSKKAGGGISDMWLYGIANFLSKPDPTQKPEFKKDGVKPLSFQNKISGYVDLHYSFNEKTFEGTIKAYATIANGAIRGGRPDNEVGKIEMRFAPNDWYINIGRPEANQRVKLLVAIPNSTTGLTLDAYLDMGKNIPAMPPLPSEVQSLLGVGNFMANESTRASGKGFAFGASVKIDIPKKDCCAGVKLFYGQFSAGGGFDMMLQDYGNTAICANTGAPLGINGWYASGQLYAYIQGSIGVYALGREYPIMDIGAAALLQAKLPNPFWMRGVVGGRYRILGGLVKGNCKFQFEMGQSCEYDNGTGENSLVDGRLITDISPIDKDSTVNVTDKPAASFAMRIGYNVIDNVTYELKLDYMKLEENQTKIQVYGKPFSEDNESYEFLTDEMLAPNTEYNFEVRVSEYKNGNLVKTETKQTIYKTSNQLLFIPTDNVLGSYPLNGMYNFYPKEVEKGYVQLKKGQAIILYQAPSGYQALATYKDDSGYKKQVSFTYDVLKRMLEFDIPNDIPKQRVINLEFAYVSKNQNQTAGINTNYTLLNLIFRCSMYDKFEDKIAVLSTTMVKDPTTIGTKKWLYNTNLPEPFDVAELEGTNEVEPLIDFVSSLSTSSWMINQIKPLIYDNLPYKRDDYTFDFSWKNYAERNEKPALPYSAIDITQIDKNPILKVNNTTKGSLNWNPQQKINFDLLELINNDFFSLKNKVSSYLDNGYKKCINVRYCHSQPFYNQVSSNPTCYQYSTNTSYSNNPDISCKNSVIGELTQNLLNIGNSNAYPAPPSGLQSQAIITYRLPANKGFSTSKVINLQ